MAERDEQAVPARPVWRPARTSRVADSDIVPVCSGVVVDLEEEREQERKRQLEQEAAKREKAEQRAAGRRPSQHRTPPPDDDEDPDRAAERWRNDRYAVKLLRQDGTAWTGGDADPGIIG